MAWTESGRQVSDTGLLKEWPAGGPKLAWKATGLGKGYANMSAAADRLFTMGDKDGAGYVIALGAADGKIVWAEKEKIKKGCVSYADGALYCREEDTGTMILLDASPAGYKEKGRFLQQDRAQEKAWPHPTIANGKLYLRDQDLLLCYDVK